MSERDKYLNIYSGEHAKTYQVPNIRGNIGGGYGRICWGEGMLERLKQWGVQSLLDVGCGFGNFCDAATLFAQRVYGLDIASVATGNVIDNPDIKFFDGQAKSLPLPDGAVEWITSFDCLEHCLEADIDEILTEFNRVAIKGFALSISYEPCDFEGVALHMTVKPESWWVDKLKRYGEVTKEGHVPITGVPYLICRKPTQKKVICYCTGRLSARLKALAYSDALARRTDRELAMVWQADDPLCPIEFSQFFTNTIPTLGDDELLGLPSSKIYAYVKDVADAALFTGNRTLRTAVRKWGSTGIDKLALNDTQDNIIVFYGYLNNDPAAIPSDFIHRLEPRPRLQRRIHALSRELGINKTIMGVYARGTDFGVGVKRYAQQIIKAREQDQNQRFLVCSDDEAYEQQLKKSIEDNVLIRPKLDWISKKNGKKGWSLGNMAASESTLLESVVDLYLLARTDFRIYHESSCFAQLTKILADAYSSDKVFENMPLPAHKGSDHRLSRLKTAPAQQSRPATIASEGQRIYYCCPDTHAHSAGINRLYRHVSLLQAAGFPVCLLHTAHGFRRPDMPPVPVQSLDQIGPDPNAIFVIPEGMPKLMYHLKDHPGRKFVIALSWHYIFSTLPDGLDWRHLNIERVLAVSPLIGKVVSWSMALPIHMLGTRVDQQLYFYDPASKLRQVAFILRKAVNIDRLKRLLRSRNPDYINKIKWVGLEGLSRDDYAARVRQSSIFVSTSMAEGFPTSCLEAMAAGAVVAGYAAGGGSHILNGSGPSQNCILAPNGDYVSLAYGLDPVLSDLIQDQMRNWDNIIANAQKTSSEFTTERERMSLLSFWHNITSAESNAGLKSNMQPANV